MRVAPWSLTFPSNLPDLVAVVGALSVKVDAALAAATQPPVDKRISSAAKTDVVRALSTCRLQAINVRFGVLFEGMAAPDVAVSDAPPFDWTPFRTVGGGAREAEEPASPSLLSHFAKQLQRFVPVRVEDARQLVLKFLLPSDLTVRRRIVYQGHADAIVAAERTTPGYTSSAAAALLVVDWKSSTNFVDAGQLTQQRTKVQMEMLALSRLTGRFVPGVLTDLTTGMRVWDVVGSVIVEWTGSAVNGALTLCEGFGLLRRILLREIAVTDALLEQALHNVREISSSGSDGSDDDFPSPSGTGGGGVGRGGAAGGDGGGPTAASGLRPSARFGPGENARGSGGLQDSEAVLQSEYDAAKARGRLDARVQARARAIDHQIRRSPFAQLFLNS